MAGEGAALAALPNVGLATISGSRVAFPHATPGVLRRVRRPRAGARRAADRRLLRHDTGADRGDPRAIDENRAARPAPRAREQRHDALPEPAEQPTELARLLAAGEFVVSVQLDPPLGGNADGLIDAARRIKESGLAQFVDVNDNPRARARMSGMMASVAIQRVAGIEVIPHLTPRDSTLTGLESTLLGAHAEGVRNVLAVTGDAPEAGDYPGTGSVYDVDAIGLVELMARLNEGTDFHGRRDRRADLVLPRGGREPDRRRPRPRSRAVRPQGRGGRALGDDADRLRHVVSGVVSRADRRLTDSAARRRVADPLAGARGAGAQRDARGSSSRTTSRSAIAPPARTPPRSARSSSASWWRRRASSRRASTSSRRSAGRSACSTCWRPSSCPAHGGCERG